MAKEAIFVRHSFLVNMKELSMAERGRLFTAMLEYSIDGTEPVLGGNERYIWPAAKDMIDKDEQRYQEIIAKRSEAGRTSVNKRQHMLTHVDTCQPTTTTTSTINTTYIREDVTNVTSKRRFVPPTLDEVTAYCRERGNGVDPETFIDFYTSKGWMVGKNAMKDWKAAVRGWEQRDRARPAKPSKPGRFDAINEAIRKELANGSRRNNGMFLTDGQPLVELSDAD